jgi:hypothetical protein
MRYQHSYTYGYYGGEDYIIDLRSIYTVHRVYELKRRRVQQPPRKRGKASPKV